MSSPLADGWMLATVLVHNTLGEVGTGFIVERRVTEQGSRMFVVTNKHVLSDDPQVRGSMQSIDCSFNTGGAGGALATKRLTVPLSSSGGVSPYREHSDADTDVCAIDITPIVIKHADLVYKAVGYDFFGDATSRAALDITVGEDIVTLGYPLGIKQGGSSLPVVRQGMIATSIGTLVHDVVRAKPAGTRPRSLRAFLVDGGAIPGSSGSPVVLKPVTSRVVHGAISVGVPTPVLLGIIAETKYAPLTIGSTTSHSLVGLGLAFDVETIKETIELFFP